MCPDTQYLNHFLYLLYFQSKNFNFSLDFNECIIKVPCENNGTCINNHGSYECNCEDGWRGKHCDIGKL